MRVLNPKLPLLRLIWVLLIFAKETELVDFTWISIWDGSFIKDSHEMDNHPERHSDGTCTWGSCISPVLEAQASIVSFMRWADRHKQKRDYHHIHFGSNWFLHGSSSIPLTKKEKRKKNWKKSLWMVICSSILAW